MKYTTTFASPIGEITLASDGENLTGLWIAGQKYFGAKLPANTVTKNDLEIFMRTRDWLDRYFAGAQPVISEIKLAPTGTPFQQRVWCALCDIPHGQTISYSKLGVAVGCKSARAIGGSVGKNPISIIIPCHRVVGASGALTGYAGGLDVKIKLLKLENLGL